MLQRADSLGVFQVESRAQMTMLPRLKPANFYDLVIEVAIVRPGPIQGDMVHPYLRRRQGLEPVTYPSKKNSKAVLHKTLGVPLFQEQAMKIAIVAAGFTPAEADKLRRAMATFKRVGTIGTFQRKMIDGMLANGYARDFAERCFHQIEGFGEYGFPESHAASFALLVYASAWLKCRYPDAFAAALLNAQPMGFYAPAQIVRDAREHGVEVRPPDVNHSRWDSTLEPGPRAAERLHDLHRDMRDDVRATHAIRLGLREIKGLSEEDAKRSWRGAVRITIPCAMSGCARASARACWSGWPTRMLSPRSASPGARRCGRPRRSAASATATMICRCLFLLQDMTAQHSLFTSLLEGEVDRRSFSEGGREGGKQQTPAQAATPSPTLPHKEGGRISARGARRTRRRACRPCRWARKWSTTTASCVCPCARIRRNSCAPISTRAASPRNEALRGIANNTRVTHFRPGHLPAAAGLGQGRGVHDHRGRKRGRQRDRVAESVRARAARGARRALCGGRRPRAGGDAASSTWSPTNSRISRCCWRGSPSRAPTSTA